MTDHPSTSAQDREDEASPQWGYSRPYPNYRKLRADLTPQQLFNLEEYGSIHFESAGAKRK